MTEEFAPDQLRHELAGLYERWFAAIPGDDTAFFEEYLSHDWYYVNYYGEVRGKSEYLEMIAPIPANAPPNQLLEMVVRPFPPVVVVHGLYEVAAKLAPPGGGRTRFTAIWIRREGRLQALAHHATTIASPH